MQSEHIKVYALKLNTCMNIRRALALQASKTFLELAMKLVFNSLTGTDLKVINMNCYDKNKHDLAIYILCAKQLVRVQQ